MAKDATHAVATNGDMINRPGRAYVEPMSSLCGIHHKGLADVARHWFGKARYAGVQQSALASRPDAS